MNIINGAIDGKQMGHEPNYNDYMISFAILLLVTHYFICIM